MNVRAFILWEQEYNSIYIIWWKKKRRKIMTYAIMYLEINLIAVILVGIIRYKTGGISKMVAQRNFAMAIDAQMVFFLSDTLYVMMVEGVLPKSRGLILMAKEFYFFSTALMCFFWFIYFEYMQESPFVKNRKSVFLSSFLVWIVWILLSVNIFNGMLFYVDEEGVYHRGPFFITLYLLSYVYVFFTCIRALIGIFQKSKINKRRLLILLALFPIAPAGAGIIQFIYPRLPLACAALSLATLLMYLNWLDEMISLDPLTKLNNRKQLNYQYNQWINNNDDNSEKYLVIIDANKFKGINDTYGHVEGDAALIRIADALRLACRNLSRRASITRFGGDEFVILLSAENESEVKKLKSVIAIKLKELNDAAQVPYELTVSIGVAQADKKTPLKLLIENADRKLYEAKKKVKYNRN